MSQGQQRREDYDDDTPPRVLCEECGEPITYLGNYTGQPTTAVAMVAEGERPFACGCSEPPTRWEIRYEGRGPEASEDDPTWMHPDGCRCHRCREET